MKLEMENGQTLQDPNTLEIEDSLRTLDGESNSFAILSQSDLSYIQAAGGCETGLTVEYQDGSTDQHYASAAGEVSFHDVVEAFRAYSGGDDRCKRCLNGKNSTSESAPISSQIPRNPG